MKGGRLGAQSDRLVEVSDGRLMIASALRDQTEQVDRLRILRRLVQNLVAGVLGFRERTFLDTQSGGFEQILGLGRRRTIAHRGLLELEWVGPTFKKRGAFLKAKALWLTPTA